MRSDEEILARIRKRSPFSSTGIEVEELIKALSYQAVATTGYLHPGTTEAQWNALRAAQTQVSAETLPALMAVVLTAAKSHVDARRDIGSARAAERAIALAWLAGRDDLADRLAGLYASSRGSLRVPVFVAVCEEFGFEPEPFLVLAA